MQHSANPGDGNGPERLVGQLAARMRRHALWDTLLIFVPLALAAIYAIYFLYRAAWMSAAVFFFAAAAIAGLGLLAAAVRLRPRLPGLIATARLADRSCGAKDHFLTLSTMEPAACPPELVARLRRDAGDLGARIDLKRDFPYKLKRSSCMSLLGALFLAVLIHWVPPPVGRMIGAAAPQRLRELAQQMAERPQLQAIARELDALAAKLDDPKASEEEKRALVQEMEKKLEEQRKKEEQQENQDMLAQAANTLEGAEKELSAGGKESQKDQQKGGGEIASNLPQEGQGESKQSAGGSGESKEERSAQLSPDMPQDKSAQGSPKEPGQDQNRQSQSEAKSDQPDPNQPGKEPKNEQAMKDQDGSKDGSGRQRPSEEPPQGAPPEERFYKAGEGKEGLKGARYVTVQLPEELAPESKGESMATKESKSNRVGAKVPVSNVPLPAHVPNAPMEKQPLPIEYRGIIR